MQTSAEIINTLIVRGLSRDELAARMDVSRETVSRWSNGRNAPSFEALQRAAAAAGCRLEVSLHQAEPKLVALVHDQLDLGPTGRLTALLGDRWPACRDGLRAAAAVGELGVVVGPVAAALCGAPQRPGDGRVDLLVNAADREAVNERLLDADAWPDGVEQAAGERRERWRAGLGMLTVRDEAAGVDVNAVRSHATRAMLNADRHHDGLPVVGVLRIAHVEDLASISAASPWSEDSGVLSGLRAVLASGRYSARREAVEELQLT
jgi:transcriptional regulator with XRE-family HTH domain